MTTNKNVKRNAFLRCGLLVAAMVTMVFSASAQFQKPDPPQLKSSEQSTDPNRVYNVPEKLPSFPGGPDEFMKFLAQNIRYPAADREKNIMGKVIVQFVVERDGSLTDIKAIRSPSEEMTKETERVLGLSPKWLPGTQNGNAVRAQYTVPVSFTLSKG